MLVLSSLQRRLLPLGLLASLGAWAAIGCTFSNPPDRDLDFSGRVELLCGNGEDDDDDNVSDCEDSDCAEFRCCDDLAGVLPKDWPPKSLPGDWIALPSEWVPETSDDGKQITCFPEDEQHALVSGDCVPMVLGARITARLEISDKLADCAPGAACDRFAGVVLTDSPETMGKPDGAAARLSATVYANGVFEVYANGHLLQLADEQFGESHEPLTLEPNKPYVLEVSLDPEPDNVEVEVSAAIRLTPEGGDPVVEQVKPLGSLSKAGACAAEQGLHLAVYGQGSGVKLTAPEVKRRACTRHEPFGSQFWPPALTSTTDVWDLPQVTSPSLVSSKPAARALRWDVWVEGSQSPQSDETATYDLWPARAERDAAANTGEWVASGEPVSAASGPSAREPHVLAQPYDQGPWRLSFAEQVPGGDARFGIGFRLLGAGGDPGAVQPPSIEPDEIDDCTSLRDPALLPVDSELQEGYWLFFTCELHDDKGNEKRHDIRALRLEADLSVRSGATPKRVLGSLNEDFGRAAVRAPEPLITFSSDNAVLRLWFLADSLRGETSVGLATAQLFDTAINDWVNLEAELPDFKLYPANPILTNASEPLPCDTPPCRITGVAVAPDASAPERKIRFLVTQRAGGGRDRLVTFEQEWEIPVMRSSVNDPPYSR